MAKARPEYAIRLSVIGVLLAIGIPSLRRGQFFVGALCTGLAVAAAGWFVLVLIRARR